MVELIYTDNTAGKFVAGPGAEDRGPGAGRMFRGTRHRMPFHSRIEAVLDDVGYIG
jgi:hypothetical protein